MNLFWDYKRNPFIPDPGATWFNVGAGWGGLVGDVSVAMATTIWEENTYVGHAFIIGAGNVERQIHASVVPYGRSEREKPIRLTEIKTHFFA